MDNFEYEKLKDLLFFGEKIQEALKPILAEYLETGHSTEQFDVLATQAALCLTRETELLVLLQKSKAKRDSSKQ